MDQDSMIRNLKELKDGSDIVTKDIQDFIIDLEEMIKDYPNYYKNAKVDR